MRFVTQSQETRIRCLENRLDLLEKRLKSKEDGGGCAAGILAVQFVGLALYGLYRLILG